MDIDWIRRGLERPGRTQRGLAAAMGVDPAAVSRLLAGTRRLRAEELPAVAAYLGVDPAAAFSGPADEAADPPSAAVLEPAPGTMRGPRDLPVIGTALGGAPGGHDGMFLMNGEIHDYIERPPSLQGVAAAYAVYVADTSMVPRYFPGETLHVHPGRAVSGGEDCFVVVQLRPDAEGEPPRALVKQFVRRTPDRLVLRQFNPPKDIEFPAREVASVHLIIWAGRG